MRFRELFQLVAIVVFGLAAGLAQAQQSGPLRIEITEGVIEPLPFALPVFEAETAAASGLNGDISIENLSAFCLLERRFCSTSCAEEERHNCVATTTSINTKDC